MYYTNWVTLAVKATVLEHKNKLFETVILCIVITKRNSTIIRISYYVFRRDGLLFFSFDVTTWKRTDRERYAFFSESNIRTCWKFLCMRTSSAQMFWFRHQIFQCVFPFSNFWCSQAVLQSAVQTVKIWSLLIL